MSSLYSRVIALSLLAFALGCSSEPKVTELSATTDPTQEISNIQADQATAITNQVDVLSPSNFENSKKSLQEAIEDRDKNKPQKQVLHQIALSRAYLNKANESAAVAAQIMPSTIKARQAALTAQAPKYFSEEMKSADSTLKTATKDVEKNSTSDAEKQKSKLEAQYNDLELKSIRKDKIGPAISQLEQAKKEGAKKLTPTVLTWAEKRIGKDDAAVASDPHNSEIVDNASNDAKVTSEKLLRMVREAKNASHETPEQLASEMEDSKTSLAGEQVAIEKSSSAIEQQQQAIIDLEVQNQKLAKANTPEKKYNFAKQQFSDDEAEVYKQGDKILLRLKGLSFAQNAANLTSENYPLLSKVQKVIAESGSKAVVIEGHTDSTGSKAANDKLSTERAAAVRDYLAANSPSKDEQITAEGHGDSKPIASNKTKEGRAQNRRVDVILETTATE